ncbi:hypothetical protein C8Q78DRAFT_361284 [Trametes maxima]|nr:hypothetical protein C8Q78DRAFT_361284 [Trametes maxima]
MVCGAPSQRCALRSSISCTVHWRRPLSCFHRYRVRACTIGSQLYRRPTPRQLTASSAPDPVPLPSSPQVPGRPRATTSRRFQPFEPRRCASINLSEQSTASGRPTSAHDREAFAARTPTALRSYHIIHLTDRSRASTPTGTYTACRPSICRVPDPSSFLLPSELTPCRRPCAASPPACGSRPERVCEGAAAAAQAHVRR